MSDIVFWTFLGLILYFAVVFLILVVVDIVKRHNHRTHERPGYSGHTRTITVRNDYQVDWNWPEGVGTDERE